MEVIMNDNRKMTDSMAELAKKLIQNAIPFVFNPDGKQIQSVYEMEEGVIYGRNCVYTPETYQISCPTYSRYDDGKLYVGWIFNEDGTVKV
jgi:predicted choloylglycine hydrolase